MYNENTTPIDLAPLRMKFLAEAAEERRRTYLVVAVKLPTDVIELITNTDKIESKIEYYKNAYDDNFCLKTNPVIQVVGFMLI